VRHGEKIAPVAGALSAIATLVCCVPLGFAGAAATAGLGAVLAPFRSWFIGASVILLAAGILQVTSETRRCATQPRASSVIVLGLSAAIVLLAVLFPQVLAGLLADWVPWGRR
jgi:hypothetical protein